MFLDSLFQYFMGYNVLGFEYKKPRVSSFFGNELILGGYVKSLLPIVVGYFLITYRKKTLLHNVFIFLIILCSILMIIMSGERTAVLQILIFFSILHLAIGIKKKSLNILFISILTLSMLTILLNENFRHRLVRDTLVHIGFNDDKERTFFYISPVHSSYYQAAFKMFNENKLIGVGPKNYRNVCNIEKYRVLNKRALERNSESDEINNNHYHNTCNTHPHNFYLQILSETGIFGFTILISFFTYITYKILSFIYFYNLKNEQNLNIFVFLMYLSIFINIFPLAPSGSFFSTYLGVLLFLPLSIINYYKIDTKNDAKKI